MITEIQMTQALHKNKARLFLKFDYDAQIIDLVKTLPDAKWSSSNKCWHIRRNDDTPTLVINFFALKGIKVIHVNEKETMPRPEVFSKKPIDELELLSKETTEKLKLFKNWMRSRRYSENTIGTYCEALRTFLRFFAGKQVNEISNHDVILFNNEYLLKNALSSSFQNQVVNAIKLFFRTVESKTMVIEAIHRPKSKKQLPNVLSKEEVKLILNAPKNIKHKAMLSLIYSCGLRCGELLKLKPEHVDSKRNVLIIKQGKGRKDRIAPLSNKIIEMLRDYFKMYRPIVYLFEGQDEGEQYDDRSLQNVLKQCLVKANITKPVTLHWLRHSYATHLLENGTDLRYIQEILGHSSSRTTEIYTHVSTKSIQNIMSPFDSL
jgi:integrase/recombinase XerD